MGYLHYQYLTSFKYRDPDTLWCYDEEKPNYRIRPERVSVWILVYIHERDKHNIFVRQFGNEDGVTLKELLKAIHKGTDKTKPFKDEVNDFYKRKYELEAQLQMEVKEIVAITPYGRPAKAR